MICLSWSSTLRAPRTPRKINLHEYHTGTHNPLTPRRDLDSLFDINYCFAQPLYPSSTTKSKAMSPIKTQQQTPTATMGLVANVTTLSETCTLSLNCNYSKSNDFFLKALTRIWPSAHTQIHWLYHFTELNVKIRIPLSIHH